MSHAPRKSPSKPSPSPKASVAPQAVSNSPAMKAALSAAAESTHLPQDPNSGAVISDPDGSYTGVPQDDRYPVQDADDL